MCDIRREADTNLRGSVILTSELERAVAERFREEIAPFREAKKLGAVLLQLSPSFSPRERKLDELDQLIGSFRDDRLLSSFAIATALGFELGRDAGTLSEESCVAGSRGRVPE